MAGMPGTPGLHGIPPVRGMQGLSPHLMRTPRGQSFPRHPYPMIHSDPGGYQITLFL